MNVDVILKRFENPDEVRTFEKGKFELVKVGGMTLGRATYEPGWKWSEHVGPASGATHCHVEHVGMVVSGCATAAMAGGKIIEMRAGDVFYIPPEPHDSWVVGEEPYVSLHFLGADHYAEHK
jgi:mannose-6-phosphate isomerase-like protein (cupin superfamily)